MAKKRSGGRPQPTGGRATASPWAAKRAEARQMIDQLVAAGWEEASDDDVDALESGELPLGSVCTCSREEVDELIALYRTEPPEIDQAVAITLHDGAPFAVLIWPAGR